MPFDIPFWMVVGLIAFAVLVLIIDVAILMASGRRSRAEERQELEQWIEKWAQAEE